MRKFTLILALLVVGFSLSAEATESGMYDEIIGFQTNLVTGTTVFSIEEIMDDDFAFYFDQDYCTSITPYLHIEYEADERVEFDYLVMSANGKEYEIGLHASLGSHKREGGGVSGLYETFYKYDTPKLIEAFEDPNLKIKLASNSGKSVDLKFDYDLNKKIVEAYKDHAKYRGYF